MLRKNVTGQKYTVFAFDKTTNEPIAGDDGNITAILSKDYAAGVATGDVNPTEVDAVEAKGYYRFNLTAGESNAETLEIFAKSSTANIEVIGVPGKEYTNFLVASGMKEVDVSTVSFITGTLEDKIRKLRYQDGFTWYNNATGSPGSVLGDNGTIDNPSNTEADAVIIASAMSEKRIKIKDNFIIPSNMLNFLFEGVDGSSTFFGDSTFDISFSRFKDLIYGDFGDANNAEGAIFENCRFPSGLSALGNSETVTFKDSQFFDGSVLGITNSRTVMVGCENRGEAIVTLKANLNTVYELSKWAGDVELINTTQTQAHVIHMQGGKIVIDSTNTTGSVVLSGWGTLTDTSGGGFTVTQTEFQPLPQVVPATVTLADTAANRTVVAKGAWNAPRSSHTTIGTFGEYVLANVIRWAGSTTINGVTLAKFNEIMLAYVNGRFQVNVPSPGDITFYQQNNTTPSFVMNVTDIERTRI